MRASLSDRDLIRAYREGDERAFETLLNRYQSGVFSKIVFVVRDHEVANDLFQDTWIKVVKVLKSGKYVEEGKFGPWVMRIAPQRGHRPLPAQSEEAHGASDRRV